MEKLLEFYSRAIIQWMQAWMHFKNGKPQAIYTNLMQLEELTEDIRRSDAEKEKQQFLVEWEAEQKKPTDSWPPKRTCEQIILDLFDAKIKANTRTPLTK